MSVIPATLAVPAQPTAANSTANRRAFDGTLMTIDTLVFAAWSFAVAALSGVALYAWATGYVTTISNLAFAVAAAIMTATAVIGYRDASSHPAAKRLRNIIVAGLIAGGLSFTGAVMLVGFQAAFWLFVPLS